MKKKRTRDYIITLDSKEAADALVLPGFSITRREGCQVTVAVKGDIPRLLSLLSECSVRDLQIHTQTLEEIFLHYYGGESLLNGGIDYLGGTLETYGNVNSGDSLYAIKKLVFDDKEIRYKDMVDAIRNNFIGYEEIREKCLNVIKYGNDNPEVDEMINELNQYVAVTTKSKSEKYGLSSYLIVIINNDANSRLGYRTAATFDGRKAYEPLANALTPQSGAEKNGVTAVLNTVSSLDVNNMAGAVYNLKLSHDLMNQHKDMVKELLKIYFSSGGSQIMISVINQEELKDAMIHPEKYPNLIVRVGGFSARFIDLSPLVQKEIVSRMVY